MTDSDILNYSVQINNELTDTSGDGCNMAFDKKYGIMFCVYMHGNPYVRGKDAVRYVNLGYLLK